KFLAARGKDDYLYLYNLKTGTFKKVVSPWNRYAAKDVSEGMAFTSDSKLLAIPEQDAIGLLNVDTGDIALTFRGHLPDIEVLAFSPDGKLLFSGEQDATIKIWDVKSGQLKEQWSIFGK